MLPLLALALTTLVAADFQIHVGNTNDPYGGGTGRNVILYRSGVVANCDNGLPNIILKDDASGGGAACDGCDHNAPNDWVVTRFELYDKEKQLTPPAPAVTKQQYGTLTAYLKGGDDYDLLARDPDVEGSQRRIGSCKRVKGDGMQCPRGLTTDFIIPFLECFGESEPIDLRD